MGSRGRYESGYQRDLYLTDENKQHVLERHRSSSKYPGKTKFPKNWDDDKIIDSLEKTLNAPDRIVKPIPPNERYRLEKDVDRVVVRVSYYYKDGVPVFHSAYPLPQHKEQ
jgi:hypothetical protein